MVNETLRRQIVVEASRLVDAGAEPDYSRAIRKAARRLCAGKIPRESLPSPRELHAEMLRAEDRHAEGLLQRPVLFDPLLIPHEGSGEWGDDVAESEALLAPETLLGLEGQGLAIDRFSWYRALLQPLAQVWLSRVRHPEGDALYHSLQVYTLAAEERDYDEEFQLAALLHDVGKAIDPRDHVAAGLTALEGSISRRTAWLIEHHHEAHKLREGTLGARARRRLLASEDFELLQLLADCDRSGRVRGMRVPDLDDALAALRQLSENLLEEEGLDDEPNEFFDFHNDDEFLSSTLDWNDEWRQFD